MQSTPESLSTRSQRRVTIEEWLAIPEEKRAELIDGRIVYQGMPGPVHGRAQGGVIALLRSAYDRRPRGGDRPGGWWISMEVDLEISGLGCRPDLVGWRRDKQPRLPAPDSRGLVTAVPDWICEVLSRTTAHVDMGEKRIGYHRAGVTHYWLADPANGTLAVLEWSAAGYVIVLVAGRAEKVRAPPFDAAEIDVGELFGDDDEAEGAPGPAQQAEAEPHGEAVVLAPGNR